MNTVRIGALELGGGMPRTAVVIDRELPLELIGGLAARGADLLEIRADLFSTPESAFKYAEDLKLHIDLPLLGTLRETEGNRSRRLSLFRELLAVVDAVDIEIDTPIRDQVVAMASSRTVIISEHDFDTTPSVDTLAEKVRVAVDAGAHVVKLATMARSAGDTTRLLTLCAQSSHPMIAVSMGDIGAVSRVVAPLFGSLFSYTVVNGSVAPGQLPLDELVAQFERFYPAYRRLRHPV